MIHYGAEPPWRGFSPWYGEWKRGPEMFDGSGYAWTWVPPDRPGSFIGQLSRVLESIYLPALKADLSRQAYGGLLSDLEVLEQ